MKKYLLLAVAVMVMSGAFAQEEAEEKGGFNPDNLFTGGSISLSFFNNTFLVGASPMLGYKLGGFADAGLLMNIQYSSIRDYAVFNDRLRQTLYGGGAFARVYPLPFLFAVGQVEHNWLTQKYLPPGNTGTTIRTTDQANSVLVGAGYCSGRLRKSNTGFFYMSVLWDVSGNENSPYTDSYGRAVPVIKAGVNIPLSFKAK